MVRTALVVLHASAGVGGLVTGLAALSPPRPIDNRGWLRRLYLLCIMVLLAAMVVLVSIDWSGLDVASRVTFSALTALGAVMTYRMARAYQRLPDRKRTGRSDTSVTSTSPTSPGGRGS